MNAATIDKIKEVMLPVAQKIGQGAEFGWGVVIRQQYVEAIMGLVWVIVSLIFGYSFYRYLKYLYSKSEYHDWDIQWVFIGAVYIVLFFIIGIGLETFITHLLNPDYYAIQFFLGLVK